MMKKLCLLILWLVSATCFAEPRLQIMTLTHRLASEIQPLVIPFLLNSETMVNNGSNLIVKATPQRLEEIQTLINRLDSRQQNLRISVIQTNNISAEQLTANLNFMETQAGKTITENYRQQTLRTLENQPAIIQYGKAFPVQSRYRDEYGRVTTSTQIISATTGFQVTPRLLGDEVILTIEPWSNQRKNRHTINTQSLETTVRTRLGQWVEIGGQTHTQNNNQTGIIFINQQNQQQIIKVLLKVDKDL